MRRSREENGEDYVRGEGEMVRGAKERHLRARMRIAKRRVPRALVLILSKRASLTEGQITRRRQDDSKYNGALQEPGAARKPLCYSSRLTTNIPARQWAVTTI
ncbi:hypothetical protein BDN71DRAFT_1457413 [Pleurotus eryngii]|uniref:Uncharacterized protein n=1 Tax=Pleurotus eryngii TaxID=5323 RepID=A0A9P6D986_PLEER|nr:hypothetical protein BDN71DRAFT_1457413 [Pleurotus eryngii]